MKRILPLAFLLAATSLSAQVAFTRPNPNQIDVSIDGTPYTTFYLAVDGQKPYIWPLSTADGITVTRHFPMEKFPGETTDHPHHRGLFFAHGDINGVDFWETEPPKSPTAAKKASMKLIRVEEMKSGAMSGTIRVVFQGLTPSGEPIMQEVRTVTFHDEPKLRIIDYGITVEPLVPKLVFGDTKEGTFGIRLATSMTEDAKLGGRMTNSNGQTTEKEVWGKQADWLDYDGPVDGKTVGVAIFDTPSNPRYPTYWHTRAYGLEAANVFGLHDFKGNTGVYATESKSHEGDMTVLKGHPIHFQYRVIIHDGDTQSADISGLFKQYLAEQKK
jgi:hypothetical protein